MEVNLNGVSRVNGRRRASRGRRVYVQSMIADGWTTKEILHQIDVAPATLYKWRREVEAFGGVRHRKVGRGDEAWLKASEILREGGGDGDLVRELGVSYNSAIGMVSAWEQQKAAEIERELEQKSGPVEPELEPELEPEQLPLLVQPDPLSLPGLRELSIGVLRAQLMAPSVHAERLAQVEVARVVLTLLNGGASI